jgi:Erv1 / Alr family
MSNKQAETFPAIGMGPGVWGPIFWTMLHITTLGYPDTPTNNEKEAAVAFFESLKTTLPCPICKQHYADTLQQFPVQQAVGSKQDLIRWLFVIHNEVNKQLQKPQVSWDAFIQTMKALSNKRSVSLSMICSQRAIFTLENAVYVAAGVAVGIAATVGISYVLQTKRS